MQAFLDWLRVRSAPVLRRTGFLLRAGLRTLGLWLRRGAEVLLALIVLFEEWGWRPLANLLASLARWLPWAMVERGIAALPPYGALAAFVLPTALFFPLKLVALFLIAKGQAVLAAALFLLAKVLGTALLARIFQLTQPALMRIPWFAWAYNHFVPWRDALHAYSRATWVWRYGRMLKARARRTAAALWMRLKPRLVR